MRGKARPALRRSCDGDDVRIVRGDRDDVRIVRGEREGQASSQKEL